ncbi:MAG TPA: sugar transferase, partial [Hyphomicrobiaceae bacterium]
LGSPEQIARILGDLEVHGVPIARVVVTLPVEDLSLEARTALHEAEEHAGIRVEFFAEHIRSGGSRKPAGAVVPLAPPGKSNGAPARAGLQQAVAQRPYWRVKRVLDMAVAACAIVFLAPLLLLMGLLAIVEFGPPALFWQQRPGVGGRPFQLYKIRTMGRPFAPDGRRIADADRLSAIGRFLRRFHLDELPQLFNVLIGEMSLIGPRPLLLPDHPPGFDERLAVRPGMTGWAQIKGGRGLSAQDKAALDVWYLRNASLGVDLQILMGTLRAILLGEREADAEAIRQAWGELRREEEGGALRVAPAPRWAGAPSSA